MDLLPKAKPGMDIHRFIFTHLEEVCSQKHSHVAACSWLPRQGIIWPELAEGQQLGEHLRVGLQCHLDVLTGLDQLQVLAEEPESSCEERYDPIRPASPRGR